VTLVGDGGVTFLFDLLLPSFLSFFAFKLSSYGLNSGGSRGKTKPRGLSVYLSRLYNGQAGVIAMNVIMLQQQHIYKSKHMTFLSLIRYHHDLIQFKPQPFYYISSFEADWYIAILSL
jgi:hypothetical protein